VVKDFLNDPIVATLTGKGQAALTCSGSISQKVLKSSVEKVG
jgi:hypothetical protein